MPKAPYRNMNTPATANPAPTIRVTHTCCLTRSSTGRCSRVFHCQRQPKSDQLTASRAVVSIQLPTTGVSPYAQQEVTCDTPKGSVWLATFSSNSMELDFLNSSGSLLGNECVQGSGWAASIIEQGDSGNAQAQALIRALGGIMRMPGRPRSEPTSGPASTTPASENVYRLPRAGHFMRTGLAPTRQLRAA